MRRRVIRRRIKSKRNDRSSGRSTGQTTARDQGLAPAAFGLAPGEECRILVIGPAAYCSFIIARLGRLGLNERIGITAADWHAIWAVENLKPVIAMANVDHGRAAGGIDLMQTLQSVDPGLGVILTAHQSTGIDRTLRDMAWGMADSWSFVNRKATDNGDPLGLAVTAAESGKGWIDQSVRAELADWRSSVKGRQQARAAA